MSSSTTAGWSRARRCSSGPATFRTPTGCSPAWAASSIDGRLRHRRRHRADQRPGVWAAGNVVDPRAQVITSAGAGSAAAIAINADLVQDDVERALHDHTSATAGRSA